jgi:hypothetical protein
MSLLVDTGFEVSGNDLCNIFKIWDGITDRGPNINFIANISGSFLQGDLSGFFQPYDGYSLKAKSTGFVTSVSGDLCNIFQPIIYTISQQNNYIKITPYSYYSNDYTGLVFDFSGNKPYSNPVPLASANITFNMDISVNLIIIGAGAGGGADGGGGGGGGATINIETTLNKNTVYDVNVACGTKIISKAPGIYGGVSSLKSTDVSYVAFSGYGGYTRSEISALGYGGAGGDTNMSTSINTNGGGGGGGADGKNYYHVAKGGSNNDASNNGINGILGYGGGSWNYSASTINNINIPFLDPSKNITCGGGGGSCANDEYYIGRAGSGFGGYPYKTLNTAFSGDSANNSFNTFNGGFNIYPPGYGGGGGGGSHFGFFDTGGVGGNGVVIIYWKNSI